MMQQASPQQQNANPVPQAQVQTPPQQQQQQVQQQQIQPQQQQQQSEKMDNISKIKTIMGHLKENVQSLQKTAAFTLQNNNLVDNLKRDLPPHNARFDKDLECFFAHCDEMEINIRTAMLCQQQQQSSQYYIPGVVTAARADNYIQDNPNGPLSYPAYLNIVRGQLQSSKDIHDTLMSAAQNISQAD